MSILPTIDEECLRTRLAELARIGLTESGACCRLALTDADKQGRDLVVGWMRASGLTVSVAPVGNVFGTRAGRRDELAPVMTGSHVDTVRTGGADDGNLGVLAGLEVVNALNDAGMVTERALVVAFFTNEEGARFAPDMLGSLVHVGGLALDEALAIPAIDGALLGEELRRIGYAGAAPLGAIVPSAFIELHVEQGPWRRFQHLEKRDFETGNLGFPVFRAFGGIVGMAICNDRRWPETYRVTQIGISVIVAPTGEIVGACSTLGDELAIARCHLDLTVSYKSTVFNYSKHREPQAYGLIVEHKGAVLSPA